MIAVPIDMPKRCVDCQFTDEVGYNAWVCRFTRESIFIGKKRSDKCPLIELEVNVTLKNKNAQS